MNVTPFLGLANQSSMAGKGLANATTLAANNLLNVSADGSDAMTEVNFELLTPQVPVDEQTEDNVDSELTHQPLPVTPEMLPHAIGDQKQNLLVHLLSQTDEVILTPSIQRIDLTPADEHQTAINLVVKQDASQPAVLNQVSGDVSSARHIDGLTPVKPQFFAQALLQNDGKSNSSSSLDTTNVLTEMMKNQIETNEVTNRQVVTSGSSQNTQAHGTQNEGQLHWSPIKLRGNQEQMSQQLHAVLRERLQIQTDNRVQQATIRLDPPDLGKLDISLHIEAGKLNIQINASQSDVYRALQQMTNELRQHLAEQNFTQVNVQVSSDGSQQHQQQGREAAIEETVLTAQEIGSDDALLKQDDSILTTV